VQREWDATLPQDPFFAPELNKKALAGNIQKPKIRTMSVESSEPNIQTPEEQKSQEKEMKAIKAARIKAFGKKISRKNQKLLTQGIS